MLYQLANIVSPCLKILGYHAGLVVGFPLAGVASDKLSRGACPNGAGRDFSRLVFYLDLLLTHPAAGGINKSRLVATTMPTTKEKE